VKWRILDESLFITMILIIVTHKNIFPIIIITTD